MIFADRALAQRLERNEALNTADYAHTLKRLHPDSAARVLPVADGYAIFSRPDFPNNRAIGLGLSQPVTAADLDAVEAFYRGYGVPTRVDLCPLADPSLMEELGRRGYRIVFFFNTQIRPLTADDAHVPRSEIRVAACAPADVELWALTSIRCGRPQQEIADDDTWLELARLAFQRPGVTCFLAWIEDQPVGAAAMMIRDGLGTLFSTITHVEYRGRGVQTALIRARLAAAAAAGCDLMTVATVPGSPSQRNVQRAGFTAAYTRMVLLRDPDQ
jgi:GNAT superfamily N-acetyltransferase